MKSLRKRFILLTVMMLIAVVFLSCEESDDDNGDIRLDDPSMIDITAILDTTGNSSSFGKSCWEAVKLAEDDINVWFRNEWHNRSSHNWWIKFHLSDTQGSPESAFAALESRPNSRDDIVLGTKYKF